MVPSFKTQKAFWLTASFGSQKKEMMTVIVTPVGVIMVRTLDCTQKSLGYEEWFFCLLGFELKDRTEETWRHQRVNASALSLLLHNYAILDLNISLESIPLWHLFIVPAKVKKQSSK